MKRLSEELNRIVYSVDHTRFPLNHTISIGQLVWKSQGKNRDFSKIIGKKCVYSLQLVLYPDIMARSPNEKNLGDVSKKLFERMEVAIENRNNMKKKQFVTAALEFLLTLPDYIQDRILFYRPDSKQFQTLIDQIVAIEHHTAAAKAKAVSKRKPRRRRIAESA